MEQVTLAVRHLRDEQMLLRQGGLYWLSIDHVSDAKILAFQFLEGLGHIQAATLVCFNQDPQEVVAPLGRHAGPATLRLFEVPEASIRSALESLNHELSRAAVKKGSPIVLMLPAASWQGFGSQNLQRWCESLATWLDRHGCTLLVLCHGQAPKLHAHLISLNERLSGLARLYRRDGVSRYQLSYWHSPLGVCSEQEFELEAHPEGFALALFERTNPQPAQSEDQRLYLALRSVLEGISPLSHQWRQFDNYDDLFLQASRAKAASVIVGVTNNLQVEELAQRLYELRESCGISLKIIVRELAACLRYRDERLLVSCGANIIVPYGVSPACFFSLVDSVQGQVWRHSLNIKLNELFERLRPPTVCGVVSPHQFISILDPIYERDAGEVSHQLLRLQPRNDMAAEQYLDQIDLRRLGDIACVLDGVLYLFLFACRADGVASALARIFRLPWYDLFSECQFLFGIEGLPRKALLDTAVPQVSARLASVDADTGAVVDTQRSNTYTPRPMVLPVTEYRP